MHLERYIGICRRFIRSVCTFYESPQTLGVHGVVGTSQRARQFVGAIQNQISTPIVIYMNYRIHLIRLITVPGGVKYVLERCYFPAKLSFRYRYVIHFVFSNATGRE